MEGIVKFRKGNIFYNHFGDDKNPAVFLIHGYLESKEIWDGFAERLTENYRIIAPDLPGHGQSDLYDTVHRMDDLAEAIVVVARHLGISKFHLAGHSMGGYVTLAFREAHPEMLYSYTLFHSTCFADSEEKKVSRGREIELVKQGKKQLIVNINIPKSFANDNHKRLSADIERAMHIAALTPGNGIIALLNGMMERPDRCRLLKENQIPLLIIGGKKDNYIPFSKLEELQVMGSDVKLVPLENSGHMGFIEEPAKAAAVLHDFISHIQKH